MLALDSQVFTARRNGLAASIQAMVRSDSRLAAAWFQGSLATGNADPHSDIDIFIAVDDDAYEAVWSERSLLLEKLGGAWVWFDYPHGSPFQGLQALMAGGVRMDLIFEPVSKIEQFERPAVRALEDPAAVVATLRLGAPPGRPPRSISDLARFVAFGATWPLRLIHRGDWATLAFVEMEFIARTLAQVMALRDDPTVAWGGFSWPVRLSHEQRETLDALTTETLTALSARDLAALKVAHMRIVRSAMIEARALCEQASVAHPVSAKNEKAILQLLEDAWPRAVGS